MRSHSTNSLMGVEMRRFTKKVKAEGRRPVSKSNSHRKPSASTQLKLLFGVERWSGPALVVVLLLLGPAGALASQSEVTVLPGEFPGEVSWSLSCTDNTVLTGGAPFSGSVTVAPGSDCTLSMSDSCMPVQIERTGPTRSHPRAPPPPALVPPPAPALPIQPDLQMETSGRRSGTPSL